MTVLFFVFRCQTFRQLPVPYENYRAKPEKSTRSPESSLKSPEPPEVKIKNILSNSSLKLNKIPPNQNSKETITVDDLPKRIDRLEINHNDNEDTDSDFVASAKDEKRSEIESDQDEENEIDDENNDKDDADTKSADSDSTQVILTKRRNTIFVSKFAEESDPGTESEVEESVHEQEEPEQPVAPRKISRKSSDLPNQRQVLKFEPWVCKMCQFDNFYDEDDCRICGAARERN